MFTMQRQMLVLLHTYVDVFLHTDCHDGRTCNGFVDVCTRISKLVFLELCTV